MSTWFYVNGGEIERVTTFCYLDRLLTENDDDMACICTQIKKARTRWISVARALKWDGADAFVMLRFYLVIVQAVLLYGSDSWKFSAQNMEALARFHKQVVRRITRCHIRRDAQGVWTYPDHDALLCWCGLWPINVYVEQQRGTLWEYLEEHKVELFEDVADQLATAQDLHRVLWWRQL